MQSLDYERATVGVATSSPRLDFIRRLAIITPFFAVPWFVLGTAWLQDELVNAHGNSWLRAALWMGFPAGLATLAALTGAVLVLARDGNRKPATLFALAANAVSLGLIAAGIAFAAH